jgi:hypothetical protein
MAEVGRLDDSRRGYAVTGQGKREGWVMAVHLEINGRAFAVVRRDGQDDMTINRGDGVIFSSTRLLPLFYELSRLDQPMLSSYPPQSSEDDPLAG